MKSRVSALCALLLVMLCYQRIVYQIVYRSADFCGAHDHSLLALKLKPLFADKAKGQQMRKSVSQKSVEQKPIDTQKELAKIAGVRAKKHSQS